jgi:glyoxylase-like metal-dependent hydrolase (beta-lactamase superfamily II)
MNIVNVGYDSTNYYVIADSRPRLLVDVGFPGTLPKLQHQCRRMNIRFEDIPYLLATHYHPDHAGLAQEVKRAGCKLILLENQVSAVPLLRTHMKPEQHYVEIERGDNVMLKLEDSRAFLKRIGIDGQIIPTPGHSDDSVSLVLDDGAAFTGDLTHPMAAFDENGTIIQSSWERVRAAGGKMVYPGHGPAWPLR